MEKVGEKPTEDLRVTLDLFAEGFKIQTSRYVEDKDMAVLLKAVSLTLQEKDE